MKQCQQIQSWRGASGGVLLWPAPVGGVADLGWPGVAWTASGRTNRWNREGVEAAYLGHTSVRSGLDVPIKTTINKNYILNIGGIFLVQTLVTPHPLKM